MSKRTAAPHKHNPEQDHHCILSGGIFPNRFATQESRCRYMLLDFYGVNLSLKTIFIVFFFSGFHGATMLLPSQPNIRVDRYFIPELRPTSSRDGSGAQGARASAAFGSSLGEVGGSRPRSFGRRRYISRGDEVLNWPDLKEQWLTSALWGVQH